jgi:hypothetical protein
VVPTRTCVGLAHDDFLVWPEGCLDGRFREPLNSELTISRGLRSTAPTATSPGAYVRTSTGHRFNEIDDTNFPALGNGDRFGQGSFA